MTLYYELLPTRAPSGHAPVAYFHGFMGRPAMWQHVMELADRDVPTALCTLPGHGPAPRTLPGATFGDVVDALAADLPFDRPAWLVGYSLGARVALGMALAHPARVAGAVLVGGHPGLGDPDERAARQRWDDAQADRLEALGVSAFAAEWEALPLFATQAVLPARVREQQRADRRAHEAHGLAWAMRALGLGRMPDYRAALRDAGPRLHFVTGGLDAKFTALARELALTAPGSVHRVAPGAGHNVALESPGTVARALTRALAMPYNSTQVVSEKGIETP